MFKKLIYSPVVKKIYDSVKDLPFANKLLTPLANRASLNYLAVTKSRLDQISPSFCSAKWLQSTLHLEIGETHSCHHPKRHAVEIAEVELDPSRLHNTKSKEESRKQMVSGIQPSECEYCWRVEKTGDFSDRIYKSSSDWAQVNIKKLTSEESIKNVNPSYLEVSFSSDCNLKCAYCFPEVSSAIRSEITKWGPYPTDDRFGNLDQYKKFPTDLSLHFWKWWDLGLARDLKVLRVTGGEPFLSKDTFRLIEVIKNSDEKFQFNLSINSNLMIGNEILMKTMRDLKTITDQNKVMGFHLFTSIDTWGKHAEFLRYGLNIKRFIQNIETCLEIFPNLEISFMITYQALSPFNFNQLLEFILDLRKRYPKSKIKAGISNLLNPHFLSLQILDQRFLTIIANNLNFMKDNKMSGSFPHGFSNFEIQHLERIYNGFVEQKMSNAHSVLEFKKFISEYEKRKNVNFNEFFKDSPDLLTLL